MESLISVTVVQKDQLCNVWMKGTVFVSVSFVSLLNPENISCTVNILVIRQTNIYYSKLGGSFQVTC